jgi:hypothetical protein
MSVLIVFALIGGAIWLQWRVISNWNGVWRLLAAIPATLIAVDALWIIADVSIDPTARNLWPLELLFIGVCGGAFVGALWLLRMIVRA